MAENNNNPIPDKRNDKNIKPRFNTNWIFFIVIASIILFEIFYPRNSSQNATPNLLKEMIANHDIEKLVVVNKEQAEIYLRKEAVESGKYPGVSNTGKGIGFQVPKPQYTYNIGDISSFEPFIIEAQKNAGYDEKDLIYPEYIKRHNYLTEVLSWLIFPAILIVFWLFFMRKMAGGGAGGAGGIFSVGKSRAQIFDKDTNVKLNFSDVAGLEEAKTEVMEIVDFLKNPKKYTQLGGKIPKGALLIGSSRNRKDPSGKSGRRRSKCPFLFYLRIRFCGDVCRSWCFKGKGSLQAGKGKSSLYCFY